MLIVEDGSGVANANSYVSVAEYRAYATPRGVSLPVSDSEVETQLILAMDYLEVQCWRGIPSYDGQSLALPRDEVYIGGSLIANDVIPGKIKFAQMQLALQVNNGVDLMPTVVGGSASVVREKVGPLETEYATSLTVGTQPYFRSINALLGPYLCSPGFGQFRATRG
jgi:hypothetical protein